MSSKAGAIHLAGIKKLIDGKLAVSTAKDAKNNKETVATEVAEPLALPDNKPVKTEGARRGRPKKAEAMVDAVVPEVAAAEGA